MHQHDTILPLANAETRRAIRMGRTPRLPASLARAARLYQGGEGFDGHGWGFNLGRVFSAITRRISAIGMSSFAPSFTLAIFPSYASRRQLQRLLPVKVSALCTLTYSGSTFAMTAIRNSLHTKEFSDSFALQSTTNWCKLFI
jgi:hypothetical protein